MMIYRVAKDKKVEHVKFTRTYHPNYKSKLYKILCTRYLWPWVGPTLAVLQCVMYLRTTSYFPIMGPIVQATQVGCKLNQGAARISHRSVYSDLLTGATQDRGGV